MSPKLNSASPVLLAVAAMFQNVEATVMVANATDLDYNVGVGNPSGHTSFTAESNPQMVAMNTVGLYAASGAAEMIAHMIDSTEVDYVDALIAMAEGVISAEQGLIVDLVSNIAWRAGQPFRDLATKPLDRITRAVNIPWSALPDHEKAKDRRQVQVGAQHLLNWIKATV